jgi:hypothetical protein
LEAGGFVVYTAQAQYIDPPHIDLGGGSYGQGKKSVSCFIYGVTVLACETAEHRSCGYEYDC